MSKSLGNIIDPRDVIEGITLQKLIERASSAIVSDQEKKVAIKAVEKDYPHGIEQMGVDALRLGLAFYLRQDSDINLNLDVVRSQSQFCNKIWQMTRFALLNLNNASSPNEFKPLRKEIIYSANQYEDINKEKEDVEVKDTNKGRIDEQNKEIEKFNKIITFPLERWMLSRVHYAVTKATKAMNVYAMSEALDIIKALLYDEFCDRYLESAKLVLVVLYEVIDAGLRLLHPFIPFVTEELWQHIPRREGDAESICVSSYPHPNTYYPFITQNVTVKIQTEEKEKEKESEQTIQSSSSQSLSIIPISKEFNFSKLNLAINFIFEAIDEVRSLRSSFFIKPSYKVQIFLSPVLKDEKQENEQIKEQEKEQKEEKTIEEEKFNQFTGIADLFISSPELIQVVAQRFMIKLANAKSVTIVSPTSQTSFSETIENQCASALVCNGQGRVLIRISKGSTSANFQDEGIKIVKQIEIQKIQVEKQAITITKGKETGKIPEDKLQEMEQTQETKIKKIDELKKLRLQFERLALNTEEEDGTESDEEEDGEEDNEERKKIKEEKKKLIKEKQLKKKQEKEERKEREAKEREELEKKKAEKKALKDKKDKEKKDKKGNTQQNEEGKEKGNDNQQ